LKSQREARSYHLEMEEDGSFRAEDVPPGNYELRIKVTKPRSSRRGGYPLQEGDVLGSLTRKVTIPEGKEPFDLGRQVIAIKGEPTLAPVLPLDANLTTAEGQSLHLASLRGKYVVLVFWASWSEPGRKMLADLRAVRDEFAHDSKVNSSPPAWMITPRASARPPRPPAMVSPWESHRCRAGIGSKAVRRDHAAGGIPAWTGWAHCGAGPSTRNG